MQLIHNNANNLAAVWALLINDGGADIGCYIGIERAVVIRLLRGHAIYVRRIGVAPEAGTPASAAWGRELSTFRKFANQAGLRLTEVWLPVASETPGWYAARCDLVREAVPAKAGVGA